MIPSRMTRRHAIVTGGIVCATGLAGCLNGVLGSSDEDPSYTNWLGTSMAGRDWPTDESSADPDDSDRIFTAFSLDPSTIVADPLADSFGELREQSQLIGERTPAFDLDAADVSLDCVPLDGDFRVRVGSFAADDVVSALPDGASEQGSHRDVTVYTAKGGKPQDGADRSRQGYGVADGLLVVALGAPDASTAVEYVESILDIGRSDATTLRAANDDFARLAAALGEGFHVEATVTAASGTEGVSLRRDGDVIARRVAAVLPSETKAKRLADQFERTLDEQANATVGGERTRENQAAVYENTDVRRDGRRVVFAATIPIAEAGLIDTTSVWL